MMVLLVVIDITFTTLNWIELMPSEEEFITSRDVVLLPSTEPLIALDTGIIRREATIAPFLVQLQHARVIHVRATPASGKSTLSLLLHAHVHGCQHFKLSTGCVEHLWLYSDRHPGGIMALLKGLMDAPVCTGKNFHRAP